MTDPTPADQIVTITLPTIPETVPSTLEMGALPPHMWPAEAIDALHKDVLALQEIIKGHSEEIARIRDAIRGVACPERMQMTDLTLKDGAYDASVGECIDNGRCICTIAHALMAASWTPPE